MLVTKVMKTYLLASFLEIEEGQQQMLQRIVFSPFSQFTFKYCLTSEYN